MAEPGWYRHKDDPNVTEFWDGEKWTGQFRLAPLPASSPSGVEEAKVQPAKKVKVSGKRSNSGIRFVVVGGVGFLTASIVFTSLYWLSGSPDAGSAESNSVVTVIPPDSSLAEQDYPFDVEIGNPVNEATDQIVVAKPSSEGEVLSLEDVTLEMILKGEEFTDQDVLAVKVQDATVRALIPESGGVLAGGLKRTSNANYSGVEYRFAATTGMSVKDYETVLQNKARDNGWAFEAFACYGVDDLRVSEFPHWGEYSQMDAVPFEVNLEGPREPDPEDSILYPNVLGGSCLYLVNGVEVMVTTLPVVYDSVGSRLGARDSVYYPSSVRDSIAMFKGGAIEGNKG